MQQFSSQEAVYWTGGEWLGDPLETIAGVSHDTRTLKAGALYIAIRGERFDGHAFVKSAFRAGASAALVDRTYVGEHSLSAPALIVEDTRKALWDLAAGYRQQVDPLVVGISGSVGKTTVKDLLASVLQGVGSCGATLGNWNNEIGAPLSLLNMDDDAVHGVFEIGMNQPGEIAALSSLIQPTHAVMTPIGIAHIASFESVKEIVEEKCALLKALPESGFAVLHRDSRWYEKMQKSTKARVVSFSFERDDVDYFGKLMDEERLHIQHRTDGVEIEFTLPQAGMMMAHNVLSVYAASREMKVAPADIVERICSCTVSPMRWQVTDFEGVCVVNDAYNANPISMRAALETFEKMPSRGQKWIVLGDMLELGHCEEEEHLNVGRCVAALAGMKLVTVGKRAKWIREGAQHEGMLEEQCASFSTAQEAGEWLMEQVAVGDAVLLKGSRGMALEGLLNRPGFAGVKEVAG